MTAGAGVPVEPIADQVASFSRRDRRVQAQIEELLAHVDRIDPVIRAYHLVLRERALARAAELDRGAVTGALHGIAVAIKDSIDIERVVSTTGSIVRAGRVATKTASCVDRLREAGAVTIGKTLLDEWAFGGSTENPHFGRVANPWSPGHTTGGSSGGSAAAVAGRMATIALGTDTGGSVRLPAAHCGVVGFKPTLGRLPLDGIAPLAPTYDTLGLFALFVADLVDVMGVLDPSFEQEAISDAAVVVHPRNLPRVSPEVTAAYEGSLRTLTDLGVQVEPVDVGWMWDLPPHFRAVVLTELAAAHQGPEVAAYGKPLRDSIAAGRALTERDYQRGIEVRDEARERFASMMDQTGATLFAAPMTATPADPSGISFDDPVIWADGTEEDYFTVSTRFTLFANVLGAPALTLPVPDAAATLPIGFQLVARPGADGALLAWGEALQSRFGVPRVPRVSL